MGAGWSAVAAPRDGTLAEDHQAVANQDEDVLTVLALVSLPDPEPAFELAAATPTCVVLPPRSGR